MNAYTISKLAEDAEVSTYVIRDYELRGLLSPCKCTNNGYRIYDEQSLNQLRFVLAGKAAGISLNELAGLCKAIDTQSSKHLQSHIERINKFLEYRINLQKSFRKQLGEIQL